MSTIFDHVHIQCDLHKNKIEKLQKELIAYKAELTERSEKNL